jgi:hypothetical protein
MALSAFIPANIREKALKPLAHSSSLVIVSLYPNVFSNLNIVESLQSPRVNVLLTATPVSSNPALLLHSACVILLSHRNLSASMTNFLASLIISFLSRPVIIKSVIFDFTPNPTYIYLRQKPPICVFQPLNGRLPIQNTGLGFLATIFDLPTSYGSQFFA